MPSAARRAQQGDEGRLLMPDSTAARPAGRAHAGVGHWLAGLRTRVLANMGALLAGQGVTATIQLLALPLFLQVWDAQRYGKWVMLSAVPTYFSMSDAGMIPVAANQVSMLQAGGRIAEANRVFQSTLALVMAAFFGVGALSALVLAPLGDAWLDADSRWALWLLILSTLLGLFAGLFGASFRASGNNARGVLYNEAIRLSEFAGLALGLWLGRSFTSAALGLLAGRLAASIVVALACRRLCPALRWSLREAGLQELRALLRPALGYLAFPLGNGLAIQAVTLAVGAIFGAVTVAVFNTYRTLSRFILQVTGTFSHAVLPEFSRLYGAGAGATLRRFYRRSAALGALISGTLALAMIPSAALILRVWTHGKIAFDAPLFLLFVLVTFVGGLGHVPRMLLLSTNRHARLGAIYLALSALGILTAVLLAFIMGPSGVVLATCIPEAGMLAFATTMGHRLLHGVPDGAAHA